VTGGDVDLFEEIGGLLLARRGWGLEPSTSPGADPSYCFSPEHEVELSVSVRDGRIRIYIPRSDEELVIDDTPSLAAWIDDNEVHFHRA
jgi:hypothetical protein